MITVLFFVDNDNLRYLLTHMDIKKSRSEGEVTACRFKLKELQGLY